MSTKPVAVRAAQAFGEWPAEGSALPRSIDAALEAVADARLRIDDRAAVYAALYHLRRRITRALDPVRDELAEHMARHEVRRMGPLSLSSTGIDVAYPCNDPGNWADAGVQDAMQELAANPETAPYVRHIPAHLEIDTAALGAACGLGDPGALRLLRSLNARHWRTEIGRALGIRVAS